MDYSIDFSLKEANELLQQLHQHQQQFFFSEKELSELSRQSIEPILKKICQDIAKLMKCERVEIWLFNEEQTKLTIETSYDSNSTHPISKVTLLQHEVPTYFEAIVHKRTLAVDDVATDPVMHGLRESLSLAYHPFHSMLDASIVLNWGVGGVICCFSQQQRHWTPVHRHVLASVADMFAFIFDRLHRQEAENYTHKLAFTDTLTSLNNEHAFYKKVEERLSQNELGIFIYMTLDQFTNVRSVLGHDGGEEVLINFAKRLRHAFSEPAIIARVGFDHFVIYSPILLKETQSLFINKEISDILKEPMTVKGQEVYMTFSYGAAYYPDDVHSVKAGLQAAQIALEHARKQTSRKAVGFYKPSMHTFVKENLLSEMNLQKGLDLKQFQLFYQPQVCCNTGEIEGFEALIRWQHPERGLIPPSKFINLAESTGLITQIGEWVIQEAVAQLKKWMTEGKEHLTIAINLSPAHFLRADLSEYLLKCTQSAGFKPQNLVLEITENVAIEDRDAARNRMAELRAMGFSIAIDDFGTGYSSFAYLQNLPVHQIKIDRQFIRNISTNQNSAAIVQTIVQLGKTLNLQTVAEGVETKKEWDMLKQFGCNSIQGFYFSKPLPVHEVDRLFQNEGGVLK
ncbi:putative bifunctional diguanylate cyclase/phosphodiesterase [Metasolibacillus meyeri]|uniref:putative bifunctional diguanylate cyclase/phosphodiesterase n=1 Tax=Metasolibacillus meyeri TaxID=1071052 RepID=UPI000D31313F|nr:sensor domain-containing phosphodiesterase [Metasolibacillus meyeri]